MRKFLYDFYTKHYLTDGKFNLILPSKIIGMAILFVIILSILGEHNTSNIVTSVFTSYLLVAGILTALHKLFKRTWKDVAVATILPLGIVGFLLAKDGVGK